MSDRHTTPESEATLTESVAGRFASLRLEDLPAKAIEVAVSDLIDMAGNCLSARQTEYMQALRRAATTTEPARRSAMPRVSAPQMRR